MSSLCVFSLLIPLAIFLLTRCYRNFHNYMESGQSGDLEGGELIFAILADGIVGLWFLFFVTYMFYWIFTTTPSLPH